MNSSFRDQLNKEFATQILGGENENFSSKTLKISGFFLERDEQARFSFFYIPSAQLSFLF